MKKTWKIVGINFDHMHMGDLLRLVHDHPDAEIAGICDADPARMEYVIGQMGIPRDRVFTDPHACLKAVKPDIAILCPATGLHADYVELVAPHGVHVLVEKPFAASLAEADRMTAAMARTGKRMVINWPLRWYPSHATTKCLVDEGLIGDVLEVHYYDGNRGPLRHGADKIETVPGEKSKSWFYHRLRGGGSLLDYLGYGVTLGTWYHGGKAPVEVTAVVDEPQGLEVDEHSITVARYDCGLSKYETRWGTFTDPWILQPQPKCGFVLRGTRGTIASYDFEKSVRVQTEAEPGGFEVPVREFPRQDSDPVSHFIHALETGGPVTGPLDPALCRVGQQIVDSAVLSAAQKRTVPLIA